MIVGKLSGEAADQGKGDGIDDDADGGDVDLAFEIAGEVEQARDVFFTENQST